MEQSTGASSLAVRLMQVAGEFELERKQERSQAQARIAALSESNAALERTARGHRAEMDALTRQVATLSTTVDSLRREQVDTLFTVEAALVDARMALRERDSMLLAIHRILTKPAATAAAPSKLSTGPSPLDENVDPTALHDARTRAQVLSVLDAFEMAQLEREAEELAGYDTAAVLRIAELGRDTELMRLLRPVTGGGDDSEGGAAPSVHADALPSRVRTLCEQALCKAAQGGHVHVMKRLLRYGARLSVRTAEDGMFSSLLHLAAQHGHEGAVKWLLTHVGKDTMMVDERDAYDRTPLHVAAAADAVGCAKALLMQGGDPTLRDMCGLSVHEIVAGTEAVMLDTADARGRLLRSGELAANPPAPGVAKVLTTPDVMFWNASVRANKHYSEKKYERAITAYETAIDITATGNITVAPRDLATLHYNRARAQFRLGRHVAAIRDCDAALAREASYRNALAQRAECYMALFDFDRAVKDFQQLLDSDPTDRQWARRLVDARSMRDIGFYGVLGVRKDADAGAIKRAYRGLCLRWHPDKHTLNEDDMARANLVFRRVSDAYETLSDAYKRMMYDLDPKSIIGAPTVRSSSTGSNGSTSGPALDCDGYDKWYAREQEKDAEREKEVRALEARLAEEDALGVEARKAAREVRRRIVTSSSKGGVVITHGGSRDSIPQGSIAAAVQQARASAKSDVLGAPNAGIATAMAGRRSVPSVAAAARSGTPSSAADDTSHVAAAAPEASSLPPLRSQASFTEAAATRVAPTGTTHHRAVPSAGDEFPAPRAFSRSASPPPPPPSDDERNLPSLPTSPVQSGTASRSSSRASPGMTAMDANVAATAARARAAVAQAEAFVRMVSQHADEIDRAEAAAVPSSSTSRSSPARGSTRPSTSPGVEHDMDATRSRFEARLRAQAAAAGFSGRGNEPAGVVDSTADLQACELPLDTSFGDAETHDPADGACDAPPLDGDADINISDDADVDEAFDPAAYAAYLRNLGGAAASLDDLDDEAFLAAVHRASSSQSLRGAAAPANADAENPPATNPQGPTVSIGRRKPIPSLDVLEAELAGLAAEAMQAAAATRARHMA